MRTIFDDIYLLDATGRVNTFVLGNKSEYCLVDTGFPDTADAMIEELQQSGYPLSHLTKIIITHDHPDHIGGLPRLLEVSNPKLYAHKDDVSGIEQKVSKALNRKIAIDVVLVEGSTIEVLGGLEVISTPGHTLGCIALYQRQRKIMFLSDVIKVVDGVGLQIAQPEKYNRDTAQTIQDGLRLLSYDIESALLNHGQPILKADIQSLYDLKKS